MNLCSKVSDNLYFGNVVAKECTAVVNLGNAGWSCGCTDIYDFSLSNNELLPDEYAPMRRRLETIAELIQRLHSNGHIVAVRCDDGREKSVLMVGYYLITRGGMDSTAVINYLVTAHFTAEQREAEHNEAAMIERALDDNLMINFTAEQNHAREERQRLKCLTRASYRDLLRTVKSNLVRH